MAGTGAQAALASIANEAFEALDLELPGSRRVARRCLVLVPRRLAPGQRVPLVVLLHGYAQAHQELRAINAWRAEFGIQESYARLTAGVLEPRHPDTGYLDAQRRRELEAELTRQSFRDLVLACPATPNPYREYPEGDVFELYAEWLEASLLPAIRQRAPVLPFAASTGLAGVSMGGYVGLEVMLRRPYLFGAFNPIQAAIEKGRVGHYARGLAEAYATHGPVATYVLTSLRDSYKDLNRRLAARLAEQGVGVAHRVPPGTHQNVWVQETGSLETLFWNERVLSRDGSIGGYPPGLRIDQLPG